MCKAGKRNEALAIAKELETRYTSRQAKGQDIALVYVGLNDMDKAFEWLEQDFRARSGIVQFVRSFPEFESLRSDPRYAGLMRRIGLST